MAKPKKEPLQSNQHGAMLAGKNLINQNSLITANPMNEATHERVWCPVRRGLVERRKIK